MSAPTPLSGDGSPTPGFYPDPSIPGYVRYWNGSAWVPGTSRPAPQPGEPMPTAPAVFMGPRVPQPEPVEETGPVFLDEEPLTADQAAAPSPAPAWGSGAGHPAAFGQEPSPWGGADPRTRSETRETPPDPRLPARGVEHPAASARPGEPAVDGTVALGSRHPAAPSGSAAGAQPTAPHQPPPARQGVTAPSPGQPSPQPGAQPGARATAAAPAQHAVPSQQGSAAPPHPSAPHPQPQPQHIGPLTAGPGGGAASWPQQVQRLARGDGEAEPPVVPWKPPVEDPFLQAARAQASARPAAPGRRLVARFVDTVVLAVLVGAVAVPVGTRALGHVDDKIEAARHSGQTVTVWLLDSTTVTYLGIVVAALLVIGLVYEALPTARWGRTLGKKLCGLTVVDIESHGPPSFGAALRRWLVYGVLGVLAVGVLNVLWCLFDRPWRQCWHDKAAHTFVTRR
ncbi:RDD family protein [Streptomyces sp. NPDC057638]|uniref:RDD family protein n=1 Tax=Streptomyces sp. NPDC057638 TaxID=3346190 RepID=UPI00367C4A9E